MQSYLSFFTASLSLLVVSVPEGLPLAVTLALAFSVTRMLADANLVRNLSACETMAAATSVCSDKTGTLTAGSMRVVQLVLGGQSFNVRPSTSGGTAGDASTTSDSGDAADKSNSSSSSSNGGLLGSSNAGVLLSQPTPTAVARPPPWLATADSAEVGVGSSTGPPLAPDTLTLVSLSWDGDNEYDGSVQGGGSTLDSNGSRVASVAGAVRAVRAPQLDSAALSDGLLVAPWALSTPDAVDAVDAVDTTTATTAAPAAGPCPAVRELLQEAICLNSTASIQLAAADDAAGMDQDTSGCCTLPPAPERALDRAGNRTECALLEFGGRLAGRLLPGAGSEVQAERVLQVRWTLLQALLSRCYCSCCLHLVATSTTGHVTGNHPPPHPPHPSPFAMQGLPLHQRQQAHEQPGHSWATPELH